jgi:hypothetical protein
MRKYVTITVGGDKYTYEINTWEYQGTRMSFELCHGSLPLSGVVSGDDLPESFSDEDIVKVIMDIAKETRKIYHLK